MPATLNFLPKPNSDTASNHTAAGLCQQRDGRCGSWANLLVSTLAAQGIAAVNIEVQPTPSGSSSPQGANAVSGFLVRSTAAAQGTPQPNFWQRYFADHAVVELAGADASLAPTTIYDPSYGKAYAAATLLLSKVQWEKSSVRGIYFGFPFQAPSIYNLTGVNPNNLSPDFTFEPLHPDGQ